jgi:hypothetical protein
MGGTGLGSGYCEDWGEGMKELYASWLHWKHAEEHATNERRSIEDQIKKLASIPDDLETTKTLETDHYLVKITGRIDRKVDSDALQQLAAEAGLSGHLASLFRWKPEINSTAWKAADPSITRPLAGAITAKPGRASFKITIKE